MALNALRLVHAGRCLTIALCATLASLSLAAFAFAAPAAAETSSCSLYASVTGSDSNPGSAAAPLRTVTTLIKHLRAGQTGCLAPGQFNEGVNVYEAHGTEGAPVTVTSENPATPALINGRVVTHAGADWLTFTHLDFSYSETNPSITVGSAHTSWTYDDVTAPKTICFTMINGSWGTAQYTLVEHDRVHGCGSAETFLCNQNIPLCETAPTNGFYLHAIYVAGGKNTTIRNNYLYDNADRAVQMRSGAEGVVVEHNIMDGNGEGVIFGDGTSNATVQWNIITNSHSRCGELAGCYDYGASEYMAVGSNLLAHNDVYGNQCANAVPACWPNVGNIEKMGHVAVEGNVEVSPLYTNAAAGDYVLQPGSPAAGYGPDTAQPEGGSGSTSGSGSGSTTGSGSGSTTGSGSGSTTGSGSGTETVTPPPPSGEHSGHHHDHGGAGRVAASRTVKHPSRRAHRKHLRRPRHASALRRRG